MSGHSKWSTIKRAKAVTDAKRGQAFSKLVHAMTIAAREGGSDPNANPRLRLLVEQAKEINMPKENVERAIERGAGGEGGIVLEEVLFEGYGPGGVAILVEAATDKRNRTTQEIKNIFDKNGGSIGTPGSVVYQFEHRGLFVVKGASSDETMLKLMDLEIEDIEEVEDGIEVYTKSADLFKIKELIEQNGMSVKSAELTFSPKTPISLEDPAKEQKVLKLIETLDEQDDVQKVYANLI